ncbi:SEC [Symbiodinium natans]|uniref:SEC protein n=1 Tax=Symbiodinium natans TaxID=878477 RepID=A0A812NBE1_9DINO|nr:SEC [Symbiodinium natans]
MKEHGGHEKEDEKSKQKQAAELFRQGQQQLRKAQAAVGDQAVAEYDACSQLFTEAISLRPHHAQYYQARGRCYIAVQQYLRALGDFVVCCRLEPGIARHFAHRGQCFRRLGRVDEALKDYDEALRLERLKAEKDPSETHQRQAAEYYFERALVHIDLELYDKAIEGFSQALDKRLAAPYKAFFHRGICYRRVGQIAESIQNLKEAINLDTTSADAHNHLGLSHIQEQNFEEARKCFANAVELDACARYLNNRGLASYHLEEYTDAAADFTAALEAEPDNASVLFNRGNAYFQLGQHQEALDDYAEAIQLEPDNATYLHHKGLAYQGCGEVREAIACYEEAWTIGMGQLWAQSRDDLLHLRHCAETRVIILLGRLLTEPNLEP